MSGFAVGVKAFGFGEAVDALKRGLRVTRDGWNGKGMWLELQNPDENSKMKRPYIFITPMDGRPGPWAATNTDLLTEDWRLVVDAPVST